MKAIYYLIFIMFLSCNDESQHNNDKKIQEEALKHKKSSKYYSKEDTILIKTEIGETLFFLKNEFDQIVDRHPEFYQEHPNNPDQSYSKNNNKNFNSEAGQDEYYILYAYFLKNKNGSNKFISERKKLIEIYTNLNLLFGQINYGGTYYGHQYKRILAYAEYSVYLLHKSDIITKTYNINKQKNLYINSLRQIIEDESEIDFNTIGNEKVERVRKLNLIVDEIEFLITDLFYLRKAQEFHYNYYQNY